MILLALKRLCALVCNCVTPFILVIVYLLATTSYQAHACDFLEQAKLDSPDLKAGTY